MDTNDVDQMIEEYANLPVQECSLSDVYRATAWDQKKDSGWPRGEVVVEALANGEWQEVYRYTRNYSMRKTFHPFRQLQDGRWHDYALISPRYTSFEVLDLESGEVVASRPDPVNKEGKVVPGAGFCPMEFRVFDWYETIYKEYREDCDTPQAIWDSDVEFMMKFAAVRTSKVRAFMENFTGQWGLVAGCVWGDDTSKKVRFIDLSRISEGVVVEDERFGYLELPYSGTLEDSVTIMEDIPGRITVDNPVTFDISEGKKVFGHGF